MIKYKVGDLGAALKSGEVFAIGHQANCFNTMNSGVAKMIRQQFPDAYQVDQHTKRGSSAKFGGISIGVHKAQNDEVRLIYNLYGQYNYGYDAKGYTNYTKLESAMIRMRDSLPARAKIGFPKIGAGLGGGSWDLIESIIEEVFQDFDVTIYVLREEDVPERSKV